MLSGTKMFHQECRFWRLYSFGGDSPSSPIDEPFRSSISLSSTTDELMLLWFDEFLRRRRSIFVCHADERRRFSLSGVDVNSDWRGEPATTMDGGGDDENCSISSLPFASSSAKSQNFDPPLLSVSFGLFCSFESRFSLATAVSYDASLFYSIW